MKESYEKRANTIITISGTVSSFGTFLIDKLGRLVSILLITGISANFASIYFSFLVYGRHRYRYAIDYKHFYRGDEIDEKNTSNKRIYSFNFLSYCIVIRGQQVSLIWWHSSSATIPSLLSKMCKHLLPKIASPSSTIVLGHGRC